MSQPGHAQQEIARVPVAPAAMIYTEGWQSWSVTAAQPATAVPYRVTGRSSLAIDCQYGCAAPDGVHQGSGLLAIDPGTGGPVEVFGAVSVLQSVPVIQAAMRGETVVVTADGPVSHSADAGPGGLTGALGRWGEAFAAGAGVAAGDLREIPPVWCSWYQYYGAVTAEDILVNLTEMDDCGMPVGVVQIDDGYQAAPGDWLVPADRFGDLPGLVGRIRDSGRRAGIWIAPMVVAKVSALYADHPDWVVRDEGTGEPVFAGDVLGGELEQFQAVEEPADLGVRAACLRHRDELVVPAHRLGRGVGLDVPGRVADHQIAAAGQGAEQRRDDRVRVRVVRDQVQDQQQHERDRPAVVERGRGALEDRGRVAQVRVDVVGRPLRRAGQQGASMQEHDRVVVDVDDPGIRRGRLGDLMGVLPGRDARADVQELPDAASRAR